MWGISSSWTFSSHPPELYDDLLTNTVNSCGTVRPNQKGMPRDFGKKPKIEWGDIKTMVRGD
jgi:hypothetical protein